MSFSLPLQPKNTLVCFFLLVWTAANRREGPSVLRAHTDLCLRYDEAIQHPPKGGGTLMSRGMSQRERKKCSWRHQIRRFPALRGLLLLLPLSLCQAALFDLDLGGVTRLPLWEPTLEARRAEVQEALKGGSWCGATPGPGVRAGNQKGGSLFCVAVVAPKCVPASCPNPRRRRRSCARSTSLTAARGSWAWRPRWC